MKKLFLFSAMLLCTMLIQCSYAYNGSKSIMWPTGEFENTVSLAPPSIQFVNTCDQLAHGYLLASFSTDTAPTFYWKVNGTPVLGNTSFLALTPLAALKNGDVVYVEITNSAGTEDATVTIDCAVRLDLKFLLEGYYDTINSKMVETLFNQEAFGVHTNITDQFIVELHEVSCPYGIVATAYAHVNVNGEATAYFPGLDNGNYYIAVRHRSHMVTWSAVPETLKLVPVNSYDFTTADTQAYGSNMVEVSTGVWALYAGDINQDDLVDPTDYSILAAHSAYYAFGWYESDINGDGLVDPSDYSIWEANDNLFVTASYPFCELKDGHSGTQAPMGYQSGAQLNFSLPGANGEAEVKLYDLNGRLVKDWKAMATASNLSISRDGILNGIYVAKITNGSNEYTLKIQVK